MPKKKSKRKRNIGDELIAALKDAIAFEKGQRNGLRVTVVRRAKKPTR